MRNELHAYFGLDENHMVYAGIALDWPDPDAPANELYAERGGGVQMALSGASRPKAVVSSFRPTSLFASQSRRRRNP